MAKDKKMGSFGKKGSKALLQKLGSKEAISAYFRKISNRRWKLHPEQRAKNKKAKTKKSK